jgi:N-formylglutamate amidohydrolase
VEVRSWLRLSERELATEIARRTSHRSHDLFARGLPEHQIVRAPCSPLVLELAARPEGLGADSCDHDGNGVTTFGGTASSLHAVCRPLTQAELEVLIDEYYHPHQAWLATRVALKVAAHGRCLVLNGLSFPPKDEAFEVDERLAPLPDIRLGAHPAHTPRRLLDLFEAAFLGHAWRVQVAPGHPAAMVPRLHEGQDRRVQCLSIELNRALYWDSEAGLPNAHYEAFRDRLAAALGAAFSRLD